MAARTSQVAVEVVDQSTVLNARTSQVAVEVVDQSTALKAIVSQVAVEVLVPYTHPTWTPNVQVVAAGMG